MAVELKLEKSGGVPWGFKLSGGADMEVPLTVVKITDRTPAQDAGLQIGDVLFRVNETDLADLPHSEAVESIGNSGDTIVINVFRGHITEQQSALIAEEQSNEEVYQIMEGSIPVDYPERPYIEMEVESDVVKIEQAHEILHDLNLTDEEIHSIINPEETMRIASKQVEMEATIEQETTSTFQQVESLQQQSTIRMQQVESVQIQQEETVEIEREESIRIQQEECVEIVQEESVQVQREECAESVRIEQEEFVRIQQEQSAEIQQEASMQIQQTESVQIQLEETVEIQQEETTRAEQTTTSAESSIERHEIQETEYSEENARSDFLEAEKSRRGEKMMRSIHQNSVVDSAEILSRHEEIENIAGRIVEEMSKIQQKQEDEAAKAKIAEEEDDNERQEVAWKSQVSIEEFQKQQHKEVLKEVSGYLSQMELESRKWSTFLQKPKNAKPKVNYMEEPKKSTYRVVIRTKKDLEEAKKAAEEEAIREAEEAARALEEAARAAEEAERAEEEALARAAEEEERLAFEEAEAKIRREHGEEDEEEAEREDLDENENVLEDENDEDFMEEHSRSEGTSKHMSGKDAVVTVEQQLAQVKEQLLALSELPTTIQMTLSIITEQLQKLAQEAQPLTEDDIHDDELSNADNTETEDEITELLVLESQDGLSVVEEESENIRGESSMGTEEVDQMDVEVVEMTKEDEEAEAKRMEEARSAKKEKEMEQQRQPLTPLERPIILPGGRKWAQPDDAVRSVRQPKLSDDKIDETISSYYEVEHWNHIWPWTKVTQPVYRINFLKYQPPPKNLDHLQNSEVYKMVHDMEPPARGITARPEKVAAAVDYLVKTNDDEEKQLPAQMER